MRCPKCGYNSFDYLDSCKKCGKDLVEFKQQHGIKSVLFPGRMKPGDVVAETEFDADVAVTAATATAAAAVVDSAAEDLTATAADSDDFGFDFMGDSAEDDDDLSFDELFEEAPEEEDVEETIEGPKEKADVQTEDESGDDRSFDLFDEDAALDDDFGFDPVENMEDDDPQNLKNKTENAGTGEEPKRPFDLPESSQVEEAPDEKLNISSEPLSVSVVVEETDSLFAEDSDFLVSRNESENDVFEPVEPTSFDQNPVERTGFVDKVEKIDKASFPLPVVSMPTVTEDLSADVSVNNVTETLPSLMSCIGAFICDIALLVIVGISFIVAAEAAMLAEDVCLLPSLETLIDLSVPYFLVLFFLAFGYFTLFHFLAGQTPGKMLTGLRVETVAGEPLAFSQAFLRAAGGLLQLLPVGLGYLAILSSPERRGWNDRLAGTRVIALRDLSEEG